MKDFFFNIKSRLASVFSKPKDWKEIEYFDPSWEVRVKQMAVFIKDGESVMDLGCGKMYLKNLLKNNAYYPVDYISRNDETIVCDFNKYEFPDLFTNVGFISGALEYLKDAEWFIAQLDKHCNRVILSYCTTDNFPSMKTRVRYNWVNHFSEKGLVQKFIDKKFLLTNKEETDTKNTIFVFEHE